MKNLHLVATCPVIRKYVVLKTGVLLLDTIGIPPVDMIHHPHQFPHTCASGPASAL